MVEYRQYATRAGDRKHSSTGSSQKNNVKVTAELVEVPPEKYTSVSTERLVALSLSLIAVGTAAFYYLPGLMKDDAAGSRAVNAFYCTVISLAT
jgi:hypothetical protein